MKRFTVQNITTWGLEQDKKYGGYKLPVSFKYDQSTVDKIELTMSERDEGYRFIFVAIEILSRTAFAYPQKSKSGEDSIKNIKRLLVDFESRFDKEPKSLQSDEGTEFTSKKVKEFYKDKKYGGYKLPVSFKYDQSTVDKIQKLIDKQETKSSFYGESKTIYFKLYEISKKQKEDLLDQGRQKIDLSFVIDYSINF